MGHKVEDKPPWLLGELLGQAEWLENLDSSHEVWTCASLPTFRVERALHWWHPTPIPEATMPCLPPTPHPPAYSTPQPRTRSGTNITGESMQPWATSEQNHGRLYGWRTGPLWVHELDWLQQLLPLEQGTAQGQQSLIKPGPQGFYINNWGAALPLTGQRCYRAERDSPLRLCTGFGSPPHQPYPLWRT